MHGASCKAIPITAPEQMTGPASIYLASASPRRRELLEQLGVSYQLLIAPVDESRRVGETPALYVTRIALEKARAGCSARPAGDMRPVLGADTAVVVGGGVLGKPRDRDDALSMLRRLSGKTHHVYTSVALANGERETARLSLSEVSFRALSEQECTRYWESGEPADKAGAYAIQGRAAMFITRLEGSYSGVMGLPLFETAELLRDYGVPLWTTAER